MLQGHSGISKLASHSFLSTFGNEFQVLAAFTGTPKPFCSIVRSFSLPVPNIKVLHELINTLHAVEHSRTASDAIGTTAGALQLDR